MKSRLRYYASFFKYCLLSVLLATASLVDAQTLWIGAEDDDWCNVLNWNNGLPGPNNDAAVPSSPSGDFLPVITKDITIDFTLSNANTLTIMAKLINNGTIINYADGVIFSHEEIENNLIIDNDGDFFSTSIFTNKGELDNSGSMVFDSGSTFYNESSGVFQNYGPVQLLDSYCFNDGNIYLNGDLFQISGKFENYGLLYNNGIFENQECSIFKNFGAIDNQFIFRNFNLFYDEGNYSGNNLIDRFSLKNNAGIITANYECTDLDGWTHYSETAESKIILSIFTDGKDIGSLSDQSLIIKAINDTRINSGTVNNLSNALYSNADDWYLLNRSWTISSNWQDTIPMKVRFYFNESDYDDIQNDFPLSQSIKELIFFKLNDSDNPYDPNVPETDVKSFESSDLFSLAVWNQNKVSFSDYSEIEVKTLEAAYGAGVKSWLGGTIPFQQSFNAIPNNDNKTVNITWSTASETMNQNYVLQRSDDGISFTDLKSISPTNSSTVSDYTTIDDTPNIQTPNYYRLQLLRVDGSIRFSDVRKANFDVGEISLYPNPSSDKLQVKFSDLEEGEATIVIYDINGQMLYSDVFEVSNNITIENIYDKINLASGIYSLQIKGQDKNESYRFIKIAN